jgi:hypothetical protein
MYPAETKKLVVMDAFLPGIDGWESYYNNPDLWHFRFHGPTPEALVAGRENIYFAYFWNDMAADKNHSTKAGQTGRLLACYEWYCKDNFPSVPPISEAARPSQYSYFAIAMLLRRIAG